MRNIWGILGAVAVVVGGGIALYAALDSERTGVGTAVRTAPAEKEIVLAQATAPTPTQTFSNVPVSEDDLVMGDRNAPVTIVEYASLTCPHCARFHTLVLPAVKKDYVDTGKVRLVYRDFPLDNLAFAGSMLARCGGRDQAFGFLSALYASQSSWAHSRNPLAALKRIARLGGLQEAKFDACLKDKSLQSAIAQQRLDGTNKYNVRSTPTIIVNGKLFSGGLTYQQLRLVIEPMLQQKS